jgi:hypothetical protein
MTKAQKQADEIAALKRELAEVKAVVEAAQAPPPAPFVPESDAEYRDRVHQMRERAANSFQFRPEILREMERACGTEDLRDLVHASRRPQGPSAGGIPSSQTLTSVRPGGGARVPPGDGTGWAHQRDLGADGQHPVPGIAQADRLMDEQDRRDRAELAQRLAAQKP